MIHFRCPGCQRALKVEDRRAGRRANCPGCGQALRVPEPSSESSQARVTRAPRPASEPSSTASAPSPSLPPKRKLPPLWVFGVIAGVLLLLGAGGLAFYFLRTSSISEDPKALASGPPREQKETSPPTTEKKPVPPTPGQTPQPPQPGAPLSPPARPRPTPPDDLSTRVLAAINTPRQREGLAPVSWHAEHSKGCTAHAQYLFQNPKSKARHAEDPRASGFTQEGQATAKVATIVERKPLEAVQSWASGPAHRAQILDPDLKFVAFGWAHEGKRWISVFDWSRGRERKHPGNPPARVIRYPLSNQASVPLRFPGGEVPDPISEDKDQRAGYPITLTFPAKTTVGTCEGWLEDEQGQSVSVWFSTPRRPANKKYPAEQGNSICLIARDPLALDTRYTVHVRGQVNKKPWSDVWSFRTVSEPELHQAVGAKLLHLINQVRQKAGAAALTRDVNASKACMSHARYLVRNLDTHPDLDPNDEKANLPGYTPEGRKIARNAYVSQGGEPERFMDVLMGSLYNRRYILNPDIEKLGIGYVPVIPWGYMWVLELGRLQARPGDTEVVLYPGPGQKDVPVLYPTREEPSPIPKESRETEVGFAITASFRYRAGVRGVKTWLLDGEGKEVSCWLSTPEKPATRLPQISICLIPHKPLKSATTYKVEIEAKIADQPFKKQWSFTTRDVAAHRKKRITTIVQQLNDYRRQVGLPLVQLDKTLSRGCQRHADYIARNYLHPSVKGLGIHREDPRLPGASKEGLRAGVSSVITDIALPQYAVQGWMATLYHRLPLLDPGLQRVGVGYAPLPNMTWVTVMDVQNGR